MPTNNNPISGTNLGRAPSPSVSMPSQRSERFWSHLGQLSTRLMTTYLNCLRSADEDVLIFTARKAACLADALRLIGAWQPSRKYYSDELLHFDTAWLAGKRLLVADDIVSTGQTLDELLTQLEKLGPESIRVLCLASTDKWPDAISALRHRHPNVEILPTTPIQGGGEPITEEVISAFSSVPRPYNLEWPLFEIVGCDTLSELDRLLIQSHWTSRESTTPSSEQHSVRTITLEPPSSLLGSFLSTFSAPEAVVALAKIRVYVEPLPDDRVKVMMMPMVAFDHLPISTIEPLWESLGLSITPTHCTSVGLARVCGYYCSSALLDFFLAARASNFSHVRAKEGVWQRFLALSRTAVSRELSSPISQVQPPVPLRDAGRTSEQIESMQTNGRKANFELTRVLWERSIGSERFLAREGIRNGEVSDHEVFLDQHLRAPGLTVQELVAALNQIGFAEDAPLLVSAFVDETIDSGMLVPFQREDHGQIVRFYRAGETIEFGLREQKLFWVALDEIYQRNPNIQLGKILLEKILVLLVRFGVHRPGVFRQVTPPFLQDALTVAYSRYGAIGTKDPAAQELPLAGDETHTLGKELEDLRLIRWDRRRHAVLDDFSSDVDISPHEYMFRRFGGLLERVLSSGSVKRIDFELFVVLCNADQWPLALAAEIRQVLPELKTLSVLLRQTPVKSETVRNTVAGTRRWVKALASAAEKLTALAENTVGQVSESVASSLGEDSKLSWLEVCESVIVSQPSEADKPLITELEDWLLGAIRLMQILRHQFRPNKRKLELEIVDVSILAEKLNLNTSTSASNDDSEPVSSMAQRLVHDGEYLLGEVSACYEGGLKSVSPLRYSQAILVTFKSEVTEKQRQSFGTLLSQIPAKLAIKAVPLPRVVVGTQALGFAVDSNVKSVAEYLAALLVSDRSLPDWHMHVIASLPPRTRIVRKRLTSEWYCVPFRQLCQQLSTVTKNRETQFDLVQSIQ